MVTNGLIVAQASVTPPPLGLKYPLIGFTVTMPSAPLPATTLFGATVLVTLIVNCGVTESTVSGSGAEVTVEFALVPVIVMLYSTVVVSLLVVTVAVAVAGTVTEAGLTRHVGGSVMELSDGLTWQVRFTVPVKPVVDPIWILDDAVPLGDTATGSNEEACRVNSCANAGDDERHASDAAIRHRARIPPRLAADFTLDSNHRDLNMNGFWFN